MSVATTTGRPRSAEVDERIITATLEVLAEVGPDAFNVEAVALRAGVGKAAIYRRYDGRDHLVAAALSSISSECAAAPLDLPVRDALIVLLERIRSVDADSLHGRLMRRMAGVGLRHPELHRTFHERFVAVRRARVRDVLARGQQTGEIRADLDLELATSALVGGVVMGVLNRRADFDPAPPGTVEALVDMALLGLAPQAR